ncbi:A disintegrin and metalloproteinase with thrombospondin motifs gon-1-like [Pomacea canaliculata]|uniref:A disintegrin and metalloproteinase with thrombospondin motifs gon-1-like n=1 Tax=Pomacea canaliculata TaxID=400727 RepID=UPI000D72ABAA|nr:A disintegrin and metalloproteinase with thrombospondin motifs gon-1-like [Pomacea canaliculata]
MLPVTVYLPVATLGRPHLPAQDDIVTGNVSESREDHSSSQSMPENIAVNVTITGQDVRLDLTLDLNASTDIPVYVFSRNKDGQLDSERVNRKANKHFAVYRDVTQGAVFSVRRDVDTGHGQLTLEGVVHVKGKVYDLKSTNRRHRNLRDPTTDGKTGSVGHEVQRRDVNDDDEEVDHNEAADNYEFIVRLLDDLPPRSLRGDAILPPTSLQKKTKVRAFQGDDVQQQQRRASAPAAAAPRSEQLSALNDVYIDVVAVADYGVFSNWYANSSGLTEEEKTQDVYSNLPQHYAFMFSGVNMIYENVSSLPYTIHVKLSSLIIATVLDFLILMSQSLHPLRPEDSPWTESLRVETSDRDRVDPDKALDSLAEWVNNTHLVTYYDHLTLFTGYDLWGSDNDSLGVAFIGRMCETNGESVSLVEDLQSFETTLTLAHEIGHSLGSAHDEDDNECWENDNYIMAADSDTDEDSNWHNLWKFSNCSIDYFRTFIDETLQSPRGQQCLYNTLTPNNIPDVSGQQPGEMYDHDAQCRHIFGPSSRLCRGSEFYEIPEEVCMNLLCDDMSSDASCWKLFAARGTSCGHHKWCVNGECVFDNRAPAMDGK